jgi:hypothetical protein
MRLAATVLPTQVSTKKNFAQVNIKKRSIGGNIRELSPCRLTCLYIRAAFLGEKESHRQGVESR